MYNGFLSGDDLREILKDEVSLALFRIDEQIRQKIRDFGWTNSINVNADIPPHAADEVRKILRNRGFHVIVSPSVFRVGRCTLDVRWIGAGCPSDGAPNNGGH
jgi:hypothetical protein